VVAECRGAGDELGPQAPFAQGPHDPDRGGVVDREDRGRARAQVEQRGCREVPALDVEA
jgi:hypothetical protein